MEPDNYGAVLQAGEGAVPDFATDQLSRQLGQLQLQQGQQQLAFRNIELHRQLSFGQDMQNFLQTPSATGVAQLFGKYPEFASQISNAWNTLDTAQRRSETTQLGSVAALTAKGDYNGAIQLLQQRINADQQSGQDTTTHEAMLRALQSEDPKQINAALGMMSIAIAGAVGPEKAHDFLTGVGLSQEPQKLAPGESLKNAVTGDTMANAPALNTPLTLNTPSGGQNAYGFNPNTGEVIGAGGSRSSTPAEGGGPASGGEAAPGMQGAVSTVLHNEGGLNPSDMNGYPTNFGINYKANAKELAALGIKSPKQMGQLTQDQAAQIYANKYWPQSGAEKLPPNLQTPYFDVYVRNPALAKRALAQSGGDPVKFAQITGQAFQNMAANNPKAAKYAAAWSNRDANNMAIASGNAGVPQSAPDQSGAQTGGPQPLVSTAPNQSLDVKGAQPGYYWTNGRTSQTPIPGGPDDFSPDALNAATDQYILTNQMPGGMGGAGIKAAILKNYPIRLQQLGLTTSDVRSLRAKSDSLNSSLKQNAQILNMLEASETALHSNAQQVLRTQQKLVQDGIIDNGSPWVNNARLSTYAHVGSPQTKADIKAYQDAVNGLTQEYTKFMNSANGMGGNAAPSDAARGLAQDLNDEGQGPKTMQAHINQIFTETANKRNGIGAQNAKIQAQLSSLLPQAANALPPGAKVIGTYKGRRVIEVNGQRLVEQ